MDSRIVGIARSLGLIILLICAGMVFDAAFRKLEDWQLLVFLITAEVLIGFGFYIVFLLDSNELKRSEQRMEWIQAVLRMTEKGEDAQEFDENDWNKRLKFAISAALFAEDKKQNPK
ncbi:MAG: hypothetical protein DRQ10_02750 [Candidatus Hydrothermota bacterium]|nr:MAG: hypothetical protein DRQ10_02750 [Candidatus Hydrothermae bacterium]